MSRCRTQGCPARTWRKHFRACEEQRRLTLRRRRGLCVYTGVCAEGCARGVCVLRERELAAEAAPA